MKRALLILLLATACFGQGLTLRSPLRDIAPVATSGLLIDENFEGTGTPASWSVGSGSPDFDNSSSPISGSQDCKLTAAGGQVYPIASFTSSPEVWAQFEFTLSALPTSTHAVALFSNAAITKYVYIALKTTGALAMGDTSGSEIGGAQTADSVSTGTHYWVFFHVAKGTGANGVCDVEFSTSSTRVGSGNKRASASVSTLDVDIVEWIPNVDVALPNGTVLQVDNVKVSNTGWPL